MERCCCACAGTFTVMGEDVARDVDGFGAEVWEKETSGLAFEAALSFARNRHESLCSRWCGMRF